MASNYEELQKARKEYEEAKIAMEQVTHQFNREENKVTKMEKEMRKQRTYLLCFKAAHLAENQCNSTKDLAIKKYYEDKNFSTSFLYARQYADENTKEDIEAYDKAVAEYLLQMLREYEEFSEQNEVGDTIEDSIYKETSVFSYLRRRVCDHYIINVHDDGIPVPPHEIDSKHQFYYNKTEQILVQQRNVDRVVDFHGDYVLLYLNGAVRTLLKFNYNEEMNSWNGVKAAIDELRKEVNEKIPLVSIDDFEL